MLSVCLSILGQIVPTKIHVCVEPQNVSLFGNRDFADINSWDHIRLGQALNVMTGILIERPCEDTTEREEGHVKNGGREKIDTTTKVVGMSQIVSNTWS